MAAPAVAPDVRLAAVPSAQTSPVEGSHLRAVLVTLDAVTLATAWIVAGALLGPTQRTLLVTAAVVVALSGLGILLYRAFGLYRARVCSLRSVEHTRLVRACLVLALVGLAGVGLSNTFITNKEVVLGAALSLVLGMLVRACFRNWVGTRRRDGEYLRPVLLVGCGDESVEIGELLESHPELGYCPLGVVSDPALAARYGQRWCGTLNEVGPALQKTGATGAIVCTTTLDPLALNRVVQELLDAHVHVQLSSGLRGIDVQRLRPLPLAREPFFYVEPVLLSRWQLVLKRAMDLCLSGVMLLLTAPLMALAAVAIKLEDHGPIFFRQTRIGRNGEHFVFYKLRTMRVGAEEEVANLSELNMRDGPLLKIPHDPRVSRLGRMLRALSIDELPQLWNVLNGTMSLVGPRPALPSEVAKFDEELRAREAVPPGITGLWQVEGRDNPAFSAYRRYDLFYIQNWSVGLDVMILCTTVESLIARLLRSLFGRGDDIHLASPRTNATDADPAEPQPKQRVLERQAHHRRGTQPSRRRATPAARPADSSTVRVSSGSTTAPGPSASS
jgi:exopolysaccharide biosynthesis polyprenyl glycosylphosphotransferase